VNTKPVRVCSRIARGRAAREDHRGGSAGYATFLESYAVDKAKRTCGFDQVGRKGPSPVDVLSQHHRHGARRHRHDPQREPRDDRHAARPHRRTERRAPERRAFTASRRGCSSTTWPETEAIDVVAKTIAELLAKSGCTGPRVAKVEPPLPPPGPGSTVDVGGSGAPPDESYRAEAEALNEQGKDKLQNADMPGALASFQQAVVLLPDARYQFNVCLTFEAEERGTGRRVQTGARDESRAALDPEDRSPPRATGATQVSASISARRARRSRRCRNRR
jgi:hypothetical protein